MNKFNSSEKIIHGQDAIKRPPVPKAVLVERARVKFKRAQELVAYAAVKNIRIEFGAGNEVSFHPADQCESKFIEEVTILGPFVKVVMEKRNLR